MVISFPGSISQTSQLSLRNKHTPETTFNALEAHHHLQKEPKPLPGKSGQPLKEAATAVGLYAAGLGLQHIPVKRQFSGSLLSADPRQIIKTVLGIVVVKKLNNALGWEKPPPWALALETAIIIHTLMLGFARKNLGHFALLLPLLMGSVTMMNGLQKRFDRWAKRNRPQWSDKQREAGNLGVRIAATITSVGVALAVYPKLFLQLSKTGWLKPIIGKNAAVEMKDLAYRYLAETKGSKEASTLLHAKVSDGVPKAFTGIHSVSHTVKHHQSVVTSINQYRDIIQAAMERKIAGNSGIQTAIQERSYRLNLADLTEFSKTHRSSKSEKATLDKVLKELEPSIGKLGKETFEDDYAHFTEITNVMRQNKQGILKLDKRWQYLLHCLHHSASHQLEHQPRKIPFFTVLGAEGAAMSCTNGCCVGSVWCWADIADLVASMANSAFGKNEPGQPQPPTSASPFQLSKNTPLSLKGKTA